MQNKEQLLQRVNRAEDLYMELLNLLNTMDVDTDNKRHTQAAHVLKYSLNDDISLFNETFANELRLLGLRRERALSAQEYGIALATKEIGNRLPRNNTVMHTVSGTMVPCKGKG
jgi:hypothetical protein